MARRKAYKEAVQLITEDGVRLSGRQEFIETAEGSNAYMPKYEQHGQTDVDLSALEAAADEIENNIGDRTDGSNENSLIGLSKRIYSAIVDTLAVTLVTIVGLLEEIRDGQAGGGGGGGGAVTVADGADVALGTTTDAEAAGNGSLIAIVKRIRTRIDAIITAITAGVATAAKAADGEIVFDGQIDFAAGYVANTKQALDIPAPADFQSSGFQIQIMAPGNIGATITTAIFQKETIGGVDYWLNYFSLNNLIPSTTMGGAAAGVVTGTVPTATTRLFTGGQAMRLWMSHNQNGAVSGAFSVLVRIRRM